MPKRKNKNNFPEDLSEEEAIALLDIETPDATTELSSFETDQAPVWDLRKILLLVGAGFVSFIFFVLILFPSEEILKILLFKSGQQSGISIEVKDIRVPFLGAKTIDGLNVQIPNSFELRVETTEIQTSLMQFLLSNKVEFDSFWNNTKLKNGSIDLHWKSIQITGKLDRWEEGLQKMNGDLALTHGSGRIASLPEFPIVGELKSIPINRGSFLFRWKSGKIQIEKASLDTKLLKLSASGSIKIMEPFSYSNLDIKVCLQGTEILNQERPDLAGFIALLPLEDGKSCFPLKGTPNQPKVDLPNLTGAGF